MPHRYKVREIAQQSGLSEATVDRVLNKRPGVRENTRAEVMQAIADLDKQRAQLRLIGRRYLIDVVMQTPQRFSDAFRAAVEAELPAFAPAMVRARFHLWETGSTAQMVDALGRLRGSHGVVLKAQDEPEVAEAIDRLVEGGVPVVTYATDVPGSSRCAYVGIDNHGAGVTAAYLMDQWLGPASSDVLITLSPHGVPRRRGARGRFPLGAARLGPADRRGQRQRRHRRDQRAAGARGARDAPRQSRPSTPSAAAIPRPSPRSKQLGRECRVFIAHDLDADNRRLLREGRISVVLHNDLRADARLAMRLILQERGALPVEPARPVPIQVITPYQPARVVLMGLRPSPTRHAVGRR